MIIIIIAAMSKEECAHLFPFQFLFNNENLFFCLRLPFKSAFFRRVYLALIFFPFVFWCTSFIHPSIRWWAQYQLKMMQGKRTISEEIKPSQRILLRSKLNLPNSPLICMIMSICNRLFWFVLPSPPLYPPPITAIFWFPFSDLIILDDELNVLFLLIPKRCDLCECNGFNVCTATTLSSKCFKSKTNVPFDYFHLIYPNIIIIKLYSFEVIIIIIHIPCSCPNELNEELCRLLPLSVKIISLCRFGKWISRSMIGGC